MDMSGMSGMGGMDMSSAGMFTPTDKHIAHVFWYLVVAVVGLLVVRRVIDKLRVLVFKRQSQQTPNTIPSRPNNTLAQSYDTLITICRELSYPQPWTFTGRFSRYFTPPSLGKCLFLLGYWMVILTMLWSNTILTPSSSNYAYKWEIVGFRAAWVSVTQLPLIYVLSGKFNLIGILTGISYERLNWLHRWVARTIFLTVIVHWSFFFREWDIAHFVTLEMEWMPMVKYGFGAWATIGWMVITGFGFFRNLSYELWFLQHLAAALVLLWLVHVHVPSYAAYNVWFAIGVVIFDRALRTLRTVYLNLLPMFKRRATTGQSKKSIVGYTADVKALSPDYLHVTIRDVKFSWKPGQHVYLSIPRAGLFEAHPFTIANVPKTVTGNDGEDKIELYIRVHSGFTRRLHGRCQSLQGPSSFLSFISGPRGQPPSIDRHESLILMATGNGASFTVPLFLQALSTGHHLRQIRFVWIMRQSDQLGWFKDQLLSAWREAQKRDVAISICIFITKDVTDLASSTSRNTLLEDSQVQSTSEKTMGVGTDVTSPVLDLGAEKGKDEAVVQRSLRSSSSSASVDERDLQISYGRPNLDALVRPVVKSAWGETGIFACGGNQFMGSVRNYVARLSDERAVHKGTGAQGIYLFCETYGW
ncbi:ferric-chelate reductase Frp1 [Elasticomyces elasticus]|uniref:ferric-chelate reductase (NADPH) n=1 Tax=Exophiala sideris TaxID=1016849 RepID=A0ABR0IXV6_9EURO|nr:ferric-chelate reductase Frp1 [Elasticomyces elasticus]KAK5022274.1 ferric-chelate reductase Frp1 [Exophiala sideris]KAK5027086.1 ferric-chelate reductase Frp1 [Exophiala sideris]KAK5051661.1 ferric-chelate reductase Frp1 [Exophiala sideris]KAK5177626.1 ferric-chelate reductase Frp1 [Eurotiomycetes sp. CCFEE 6388]